MLATKELKQDGRVFRVPVSWSENASIIFVSKYCRTYDGTRHKPDRSFSELSVTKVFQRLVNFWTDSKSMRGELFDDLWNQLASPNSPQYFNAGIHTEYQVEGGDIGLWYIADSGYPVRSQHVYTHPQLHACFIQPISDSIAGIIYLLSNEARLFSRGSGTGTNFSNLRGKGERLAGGGSSSGLISFLKIFDTMAGAIKSGGTTRRAAKMVVIDIDHPDILEFINWKSKEEAKAKALAKAGYGDGWQSESYTTVTGQNANNSVSIPDTFMFALESDDEWKLVGRSDELVSQSIPAVKLWQAICKSAWHCADPGIHYTDTINDWNTTPNDGRIHASNPCSEHLRLDNSACNLASINLCAMYDVDGDLFDIEKFVRCVKRWVVVLDNSIDLAGYPSKEIAATTHRFRDIGLGYCGLGALLMRLRLPYDSETGRLLTSLITSLMTAVSYLQSSLLAERTKPYPAFHDNRHHHLNVLNKHIDAFNELRYGSSPDHLGDLMEELFNANDYYWQEAFDQARVNGLRNAQLTVIAPTGTIGITMDAETTGIEPVFALETTKSLAGGGTLRQTVKSVQIARSKTKVSDDDPLFATAVGNNVLSPDAHVNMVAAAQPFVSGGISKTVNLPASSTVEDIDQIYRRAYKLGIKCISIYRDGSKSQPLTADCKKCGDDEACALE